MGSEGRLAVCSQGAAWHSQRKLYWGGETPAPLPLPLEAGKYPMLSAATPSKRKNRLAVNHSLTAKIECQSSVWISSLQNRTWVVFPKEYNLTIKAFWDTCGSNALLALAPSLRTEALPRLRLHQETRLWNKCFGILGMCFQLKCNTPPLR